MANIIAVIWDCDKTLIDGYMQDPIFKEYGVNPAKFWSELIRYEKNSNVKTKFGSIRIHTI